MAGSRSWKRPADWPRSIRPPTVCYSGALADQFSRDDAARCRQKVEPVPGRHEDGVYLPRNPEPLSIVDDPVVGPHRNALPRSDADVSLSLGRFHEAFDAGHDACVGVSPYGRDAPGKDPDPGQEQGGENQWDQTEDGCDTNRDPGRNAAAGQEQ